MAILINLNDARKKLNELEGSAEYNKGVTDAFNALFDLPTIKAEPRWIPCSERLPEEQKKSYWVCTDSGYQYECRWTNINHFWTQFTTDWHWHLMDIPQYAKIVAWMPLPEPYREVEE